MRGVKLWPRRREESESVAMNLSSGFNITFEMGERLKSDLYDLSSCGCTVPPHELPRDRATLSLS